MQFNLYNVFHQTAARQAEHPAVLGRAADAVMTYGQLSEAIRVRSEQLRRGGVRPGDCIGLHYASGIEYIILNYAIWRLGACTVPIPVELAAEEKAEICRRIALDQVISSSQPLPFAIPGNASEAHRLSDSAAITPVRSSHEHPEGFHAINSAFIRFTSGTTGASKGIVLSHESIHERILAANEALRIGAADRVLWMLSMSYHFTVSIVGYLSLGATIVLPANHFAAAVVEAVRRHRATLIYASPMHCGLLADFPQAPPLESLRLAISTTSSLDPEIAAKFHRRCGLPISQALGIIEVGLPCINVDFAAERTDSVGRVLPAYELRMADVGLGDRLQEISFRGPGFLDAYYQPWQPRSEIMPDGWFCTCDLGELDADGCLYLRARSKDAINVMGMKFFPQEVEEVLCRHEGVAEACVYAHRDSRFGEVPYARVVARRPFRGRALAGELRRYCSARLASYKVPERIEFVDALPRTASGKVLHRELEARNPGETPDRKRSEVPSGRSAAPSNGGRQDLNPLDRIMWCADRALRNMGYPGFKTQMLVWLSGRADAARLRRGIAGLSRRYPVTASRLVETDEHDDSEVYWQFRTGATCPLREWELPTDERSAVLDRAGELLSITNDPTQADPIDFHLLHRPGGDDVFLMQYNHMLMDNNATTSVLRLIDRQSVRCDNAEAAGAEPRRPVRQFLRRIEYAKRREAALEALNLQGRVLRGRAAVLGKAEEDAPRNVRLQIGTRQLEAAEAEAFRARVVEICGFPSRSMAVLSSVFRAMGRLAPEYGEGERNFVAGIGLDLHVRNRQGPVFQNLMSLVPISAPPRALRDRDALVRFLSQQMRQRLASRVDAGGLQLISAFRGRTRYVRWVAEHLLRYSYSLWYAYFSAVDVESDDFCGAPIADVCYTGPTWSPVGLTLLVNQFRQRMSFQATYDPQLVAPALAEEFLDLVMEDLPR